MRPQLALALDHLRRELQVGLAADAFQIVDQHRLAVGGCFGDAHVARDHGFVDFGAHELPDVGDDLVRQIVARVEHGQHDAVDRQIWIERGAHLFDGLQKLRQALEREELALQRHQDRIGGRHRVDGEQIERGRTIDQHIAVVGLRRDVVIQRGDRIAQTEGAARRRPEFELEAGEIHGRGCDVQPGHRRRHHRFAQRRLPDQDVIGRAIAVAAIDAKTGRRIPLRVEIDDQDALADRGQRRAQIDRRGGLADPALLVGE